MKIRIGNGGAGPGDDESEAACAGGQANGARGLESREMLAQGIEPEDREAFRRGELETDTEGAE